MALHSITSRIKNSVSTGFAVLFVLAILIITIPGAYLWLPAKVRYHIVEKHTISVSNDQAWVNIGIIIPKSGPYQTVSNPKIHWGGEQEWISYGYTDTCKLRGEIKEGQPQQVILEYDVILQQVKTSWVSPVEKEFTLPNEGIESDHPVIINKTIELLNDPYRIYQFTAHHLVFTEEDCGDSITSALEAYRLATGSCVGYSRLMVALCRAAGIPARVIVGTILPDDFYPLQPRSAAGIPGSGHAWVEYYSQGSWHLADPSWGKGLLSLLEFNRVDGLHLSFGEYDNFYQVRDQLFAWAARQSFIEQQELTYIIASSKDSISVSSDIGIVKKWDGRWVNTLAVFAIVTILLCKIRDKFFPPEKSSNTKNKPSPK
jgi:hypothetical protein